MITIYHNPRCTKSRKTLELLEHKGLEFETILYLNTPPSASELKSISEKLGLSAQEFIRKAEYAKLGIEPAQGEQALFEQMSAHPILIERPIVINGGKARIGRPPENVLDIL